MSAALPKYVEDHSRWIIEIPVRILVIIVVTLVLRFFLHRLINRLVRPVHIGEVPRILRPFKERAENSALFEATGLMSERRAQRAATVGSVLKSGVSFTLLVIASLTILSELEIDLAPFIAGTSIVGVALGFGAQNVVKDFLSGMFMMLEDQYGVGDVIDFEKATGTVEAVGLRTTRLRDVNGTVWYVRNGEVVRVGNKSQGYARVVLDVPIAASDDLDAASAAILAVAHDMRADEDWTQLFLDEPVMEGVERLTLEETVLRLVARVRPGEQWRVARELRRRIRDRLARMNIEADVRAQNGSAEPTESGPESAPQ
ncbi:MAG TPA: mechanosensitive ion channel domain-containing protein [Jatrophihabitantaceae bacterium]|nr:mechanosensitive ion channel domain-containing protein [Jatrophihabitantaceae bacterium]